MLKDTAGQTPQPASEPLPSRDTGAPVAPARKDAQSPETSPVHAIVPREDAQPNEGMAPLATGTTTFLLLLVNAGVNRRMAEAIRVKLKRKRNQLNEPCDEAEFNAALESMTLHHADEGAS